MSIVPISTSVAPTSWFGHTAGIYGGLEPIGSGHRWLIQHPPNRRAMDANPQKGLTGFTQDPCGQRAVVTVERSSPRSAGKDFTGGFT